MSCLRYIMFYTRSCLKKLTRSQKETQHIDMKDIFHSWIIILDLQIYNPNNYKQTKCDKAKLIPFVFLWWFIYKFCILFHCWQKHIFGQYISKEKPVKYKIEKIFFNIIIALGLFFFHRVTKCLALYRETWLVPEQKRLPVPQATEL